MDFDRLVTQKAIVLRGKGLRDGDLDVLSQVLRRSDVLKVLCLDNNEITLAKDLWVVASIHQRLFPSAAL